MSEAPQPTATAAKPSSARVLPALVLAMLAFSVVQTAVVPILPSLAKELNVSGSNITWLMTANLLSAAVLTPLLGRFGDLRGRKPMLLVSLAGLVAGSALAVGTHSFTWLVVARVLQGAGGGVLPLAISIVRDELPREKVTGGVALISASMGVGSGLGLVATGLLLEHWSYKSIFWMGLVFGLIAVALVALRVPKDPVIDKDGGADPLGALTLAGWLSALLVAVSQGNHWGWTSNKTLGLFAVAAVIALVWIVIETKVSHPLVDMKMMSRPAVAFTNISGLLIGFGMYGSFLVISNFAQTPEKLAHYGFTATVLHAGVMLLPSAVGSMVAAPVGAMLIARRGPRLPLVLGGVLGAVSMAYLAVRHSAEGDIYTASAVFGLGVGLAYAAMPAFINGAVPIEQSGIANGMNAVLRTVGGAVGTAVMGAILTGDTIKHLPIPLPTLDAYKHAFWTAAVMCLVAAAVPFAIRRIKPAVAAPVESSVGLELAKTDA
ncbi:MFS transporter [Kitasatospora atroaurantiaca]|uniref:EmrB/QacA subfamily drug resistance transporter n=1 Tax=Kitasatospora atroaurantiaca TaxID=285545 RepID=A0A561EK79_9ACTN|nr:MFS transporter [Kitasatospora atroaurantiaca]TWE16000.1 EmrB/QacA subfamily drug resistance transporter [Kitasatospora atroaurantiaca]